MKTDNRRKRFGSIHILGGAVAAALLLSTIWSHKPEGERQGARPLQRVAVDEPLGFEENRGQFHGPARFVAHAGGYSISLEPAAAVMMLRNQGASVRMRMVGGRVAPLILGRDELPGRTHYLRGEDPAGWVTEVPSYRRVAYEEVYPGIDLVFRGVGDQIEYDFVVAPGADPGRILLAFDGAERARLEANGDLVLDTPAGPVRQRRPLLYQEVNGERREVAGSFAVRGRREVGFHVGAYDATHSLVIDPVLVYATLHGGCRGFQGIQDVAVDAQGNAYVTGYYPWDCDRGLSDAFVTKFDPAGTRLFRTNLGGHFADEVRAVTVDTGENIYLTGSTTSSTCCRPFPSVNPFQANNAGGRDAFVIKLDPTGGTILFSTFLGGAGEDRGADIKVDARGRIYVAGRTTSTDFPMMNPRQATLAGASDAFVTVFEPSGSTLVFSTYLGGGGEEAVARIAVADRDTIVAGTTSSADFPARRNSFQPAFGGGASDAFVAVFSPGGGLQDASYFGGSGKDEAFGLAMNGTGHLYVTGGTDSTDFPTSSALQPALSFPSEADAFLAKIDPRLSRLTYSTYLGVSRAAACPSPSAISDAPCGGVAVDGAGNAYVTAGGVFVTKVDASGASRLYSHHGFGGHSISVRNGSEILVAGRTNSSLFPTVNAFQGSLRWFESESGWLARLNDGLNPGAAFEETDSRLVYSGAWESHSSPDHSGGTALRSMEAGATVAITFTGTGLQVIGWRDPSAGIVRVSRNWDSSFPNTPLDCFGSPAEARSLLVSFSGLNPNTYTVTLEVAGAHSNRSDGDWVWVDGINVLP